MQYPLTGKGSLFTWQALQMLLGSSFLQWNQLVSFLSTILVEQALCPPTPPAAASLSHEI
jgi:hypothetical protein